MEKVSERVLWVTIDRKIKGWFDLTKEEFIQAINNSDGRSFGTEGVDPRLVLNLISQIQSLTEEERISLSREVRVKAGLIKNKKLPR